VSPRTFFFLHVMKTAGTSFVQHLPNNFAPSAIYPSPDTPVALRREQYWEIDALHRLDPRIRDRIQIFHGHLPFLVADMVGADTVLTILREPVERTISHIRHCRRHFPKHRGRPLEEVYEDPWLHPLFFRNYQVKQFALTPADRPKAHNEDILLGEERLEPALRNLERVTVLGLTHRYDEFCRSITDRFGWRLTDGERLQVAPAEMRVTKALRARIEADNQLDLAFYEQALVVHDRQPRPAR
jgi:hypothetical protein